MEYADHKYDSQKMCNTIFLSPSVFGIDPLLGRDFETNNKYNRCYAVGE
jgi:hypothetical protein